MENKIKKLLNGILEPLDVAISRVNTVNDITQKYARLVEEVHGLFAEVIFPDLPNCDGRIELMTKLIGTSISEAMYILQYLHKSLDIEGDVCEFGIAQGATSALIANEIRKIEDTVAKVQLSQKVCFAYIDFDLYNPILIGLNFLDKYLSVGGYVIVDDYGFLSSGAKTAVDEFIVNHQNQYETILPHKFAGKFIVLQKKA
jgi:hypothetical protein